MSTGSKHGHESTLYAIVLDDFGVVEKLGNRQERWCIMSIHGHVLMRISFNGVNEHQNLQIDYLRTTAEHTPPGPTELP